MASISGPGNDFSRIVQEQQDNRDQALNTLEGTVVGQLREAGVDVAGSAMKPGAAAALKGYAKILSFIDAPIAVAIEELFTFIGVPPNIYTAAVMLLESNSIGLDPHEKLGIPAWKYTIIQEIQDQIEELREIERSAGLSEKIDRKQKIEEAIKNRLEELKTV